MYRYVAHVKKILPLSILLLFVLGGGSIVSALVLMGSHKPWISPSRYMKKHNSVESTPASIAAGKNIYIAQCIACHGTIGHGDGIRAAELKPNPRDLADPNMWLQTDGELMYKISRGRTPMPSFKKIISYQQIWQVINYIRTLAPEPTVLGYRFDAGQAARATLGKVIDATTRASRALADDDAAALSSALNDLTRDAQALPSIDITSRDKYIVRGWKSMASALSSNAQALQSASGKDAQTAALNEFSKALALTIRLFGGVETGLLYQFETSGADQSGTLTWFQKELTPQSPYGKLPASDSKPVFTFGPQTSTE